MTVTHVYTAAGTYSAILTVTDNNDITDHDATVITVQTPQEGMEELIVYVESMELPLDIETGSLINWMQQLEQLPEVMTMQP